MTNDIFCCKNWCKTIRTKWPGDCIIKKLWEVSSNINKVIKAVLNLFFFMIRFYTHKKHKKEYKAPKDKKSTKTQPSKSTRRKEANKDKKCD